MDPSELDGSWDYSTLPPNVRLGEGCFLQSPKSFRRYWSEEDPGLVLGRRVHVFGGSGFGIEAEGSMAVGDDCMLVGASFMCAGRIVVGDRVTISYNVIITDSDFHPLDPELRRLDAIANAPGGDMSSRPAYPTGTVEIGDDVRIGLSAIILKDVHIGSGSTVGPGRSCCRTCRPELP